MASNRSKPARASASAESNNSAPALLAIETLQSGVRFQAKPGPALATTLSQWIGCQRVVYNAKTEEDRCFAAQRRSMIASGETDLAVLQTPLDRQYAHFKNPLLTPWLSGVPSQILRNGCDRWMAAKQRQLKGLAQAPSRRNKSNFNSVLITNELFRFTFVLTPRGQIRRVLELGSEKHPVGWLDFNAHRAYGTPKQVVIRRVGAKWWLSFSYAQEGPQSLVPRTPQELSYELNLLGDAELDVQTLGIDRNVKDNRIATSDGRFFDFSAVQKERLARKEKGARRQQKRLARQQRGSKSRAKTCARLARKKSYGAEVRRDFSHQTSHALARDKANGVAPPGLVVLEKLSIQAMSARPKPKLGANGRYRPNRAAQKAGLNRAILASCWGAIGLQLAYKCARRNAVLAFFAPAYTSQMCSRCGHTHPGNHDEARFVCHRCAAVAHADTNAGRNIAAKGAALIRARVLEQAPKPKRRIAIKRRAKKMTAEITGAEGPGVPVESLSDASRSEMTGEVQSSKKQEYLTAKSDAPTTALCA